MHRAGFVIVLWHLTSYLVSVAAQDDTSTFRVLNEFAAPEATQAVAVDDRYFYAIANAQIAKYQRSDGKRITHWKAGPEMQLAHLNSGIVIEGILYCCNSNYPHFPEVSSVESFSPATLEHIGSHSFGIYEGSLTWVDRHDDSWWAV